MGIKIYLKKKYKTFELKQLVPINFPSRILVSSSVNNIVVLMLFILLVIVRNERKASEK